MRVLVVGATGGSGRAAVRELLARGHIVTALVRRPDQALEFDRRVQIAAGDATRPTDVDAAVRGQDAVVVTLGIRENALRVRLRGSATTPLDVRSAGTKNVIAAMRRHGVGKLVVQSSYGVGDTRDRLPLRWRLIFALFLKPQIADTEVQEEHVRSSGLQWVLAQPVGLTDEDEARPPFASPEGEVRSMAVSRRSVARFLADAVEQASYDRLAVALSQASAFACQGGLSPFPGRLCRERQGVPIGTLREPSATTFQELGLSW
jgi:uncharacterized protein YbjT (DUF2867 family)